MLAMNRWSPVALANSHLMKIQLTKAETKTLKATETNMYSHLINNTVVDSKLLTDMSRLHNVSVTLTFEPITLQTLQFVS